MKRTASLFALVTLGAIAGSAMGQPKPPPPPPGAPITPQQRAQQLQQLQQLRQNARLQALQAAAAGGAGGAPQISPPFGAAGAPAAAGAAGRAGAGGASGAAGAAGAGGVRPLLAPAISPTAELAALAVTRADRKKASAAAVVNRWGDFVKDDKAKAELKLHAQRVAYLNRIKTLAQRNGAVGLANSVDQLLFTEEKRDFDVMTALKGGAK